MNAHFRIAIAVAIALGTSTSAARAAGGSGDRDLALRALAHMQGAIDSIVRTEDGNAVGRDAYRPRPFAHVAS